MLDAQGTVGALALTDEEEAFHIVAVEGVILAHVIVDIGADQSGLAGSQLDGGAVQGLESDLGIGGIHVAVAVQIGILEIVDLDAVVRAPVKQDLRVHAVGDAVVVEVQTKVGGSVLLAVHRPADAGVERDRVLGTVSAALDPLGEEITVEVQGHGLVGEVGHGKAGAEAAVHLTELHLDLAVGNGVIGGSGSAAGQADDLDEGAGGDRRVHIHKAGALLHDGPVVAGGRLAQRHGGGHQQRLGDGTLSQFGELLSQTGFADVLLQHSVHAGDLRRGHGGTGHHLIPVVSGGGSAAALVGAPDRPDVAAGGGDFGLHGQRAVAAP